MIQQQAEILSCDMAPSGLAAVIKFKLNSKSQHGVINHELWLDPERYRGNHQAARPHYEEALKAYQKLGQKYSENVMRSELGHLARLNGDLPQAKTIYHQTLVLWQDLGSRAAIANQFECFAFIAVAEEEPQRAAKLLGAAEALREKAQSQMTDTERVEYDQSVARLRAMLAETEFNALWADGKFMTMEQAIRYALSEQE